MGFCIGCPTGIYLERKYMKGEIELSCTKNGIFTLEYAEEGKSKGIYCANVLLHEKPQKVITDVYTVKDGKEILVDSVEIEK